MRQIATEALRWIGDHVRRSPGVAAIAIALSALVVLVIVVLPPLFVDETGLTPAQRLEAENDVRSTLLQALGGAALLGALYFTARIYQLDRESSALTVRREREGQVTERFTRAIEQLGSEEKPDVRLGAIYALERIARESENDHGPIMGILAAHVRRRAPLHTKKARHQEPPTDIQAVLEVLGRLDVKGGDGKRLDLSFVDLQGAKFGEGNFEDAILTGAHLEAADLDAAHLEGAELSGAHLESAHLSRAHLEGANLKEAHLEHADLTGAHLEGADLFGAHLEHAVLVKAHLESAVLTAAHLEGASLSAAHLEGADLEGANLEGADLEGVTLDRAQLEGALGVTAPDRPA
ncbi:MAG: pentapeptide repeat-containing protein [Actinomycetota bacterium]|nr:pentapeptide repeat-containing protein [Actinomycetota bacterium]